MSNHNSQLFDHYPSSKPESLDVIECFDLDDPELYHALGREDYIEPSSDEETPTEASCENVIRKEIRLAEICEELEDPTFKFRRTKPRSRAHELQEEAVALILGIQPSQLPPQTLAEKEYDDYDKKLMTGTNKDSVVQELIQRNLRTAFRIARINYSQRDPGAETTIEDCFQTEVERITRNLYRYNPAKYSGLKNYLSLRGWIAAESDPSNTNGSDSGSSKDHELKIDSIEGLPEDECDSSYDVVQEAHAAATSSEVRVALSHVSYREREVLKLRHGVGTTEDANGHPQTLDEVGVKFNITRERVRQIERHTAKRLVKHIEENPDRYPFIAAGETRDSIEPHHAAPKPAPTMQKVYRARRRLEALDAAITQSDDKDAKTKLRANRTIVNNFLAEWDPAHARIAAKKKRELEETTTTLVEADSNDRPTPTIESPPMACPPLDTVSPIDTPKIPPRNFQVKVNVKTPIPPLHDSPSTEAQKPEELPQQPVRLRDKLKRILSAKSKIS